MPPIVLFLDLDGVFSIKHEQIPHERINGIKVHPIPMAGALMQAIDADPTITPCWLTSWGEAAQAWNKRYGTKKWSFAYPIPPQEVAKAERKFPPLHSNKHDDKLIAAWWYLYSDFPPGVSVIWMEDGFAPETIMWAHKRGNVRLIDTRNPDEMAGGRQKGVKYPFDDLLQKCGDQQDCNKAAKAFMEKWIDPKVTV